MSCIFIQIASYRDSELTATVQDAIQKAAYPQNLSFGIVWQGKLGVDPLPVEYLHYCRLLLVDADHSRGVCWARSKTQALWEGEPYTLQIDSHMRFVHGWDELLLGMLMHCPSPKPLLTAYPPAYTPPDILHTGEPTRLAASHFTEQGILSLVSGTSLRDHIKPQLGMFMAAGFWFASSQILEDIPYDPQIYFQGEEINLAVRAWTHGWDIYYPNQVACYHEYTRPGKPRHWEEHNHWWQLDQTAHQRLRQLLKMDASRHIDLDRYGLGTQRSLSHYEQFSGVDFRHQQLTETAKSGMPRLTHRQSS